MSEINNPTAEDLVKNVRFTLQRSNTVPMPIDPTLSNEGEAADAKATGDAIAAIAAVRNVNGETPDSAGNVIINATEIPMSDVPGAQTISEAMVAAQAQTGHTIKYETGGDETIKTVVDEVITAITDGCTQEEINELFEDWEEEA